MPAKVQLSPAIPFEDGLLCIPDKGEEFLEDTPAKSPLLEKKRIVFVEEMHLLITEEFVGHPFDPGCDKLDIHPYPAVGADDSSGIAATMRDGEMESFAGQERLAGIGDPDLLQRKLREQVREQISAG